MAKRRRHNPQHTYRTESSFRKALAKYKASGELVDWYGTDHGWVIRTKKIIKTNPKRGMTVPAHVRINPRTGKTQVFVTPQVANKLRGMKGIRLAGNPRTFKDVRIGETFYFAPATHGYGDSYSRGPFVKNGPRKYTEDRGTGKLIQHKIGSTSAKVQ